MTKSKFQIVGSLLRPADLLDYKRKIEVRDDITYPFYNDFPGYQEVETNDIKQVVQEEIAHGIDVLTDGEYSKSLWHLDFLWGFSGIRRFISDHGYNFKDHDGGEFETRKDIGIEITGPLSGKNHHFIDVFNELKAQAGENDVKLTVWGAAHAYTELYFFNHSYGENEVYKTKEELRAGLIGAYKDFLTEYAAAGGKIIQFDDCLWELFDETNPDSFFKASNIDLPALADEFVSVNNEVADFAHGLGLKVWAHNCRGNYQSRHASGGTYSAIAEKFLANHHYDRFFLEWDDSRAGDLSALAALKDNQKVEVVLGLLSSKTATLDDEEKVIKSLDQASQYISKDRLFLSHQCGFASCDEGNELTIAEQWAKIDQGQRIAQNYFSTVEA